MTNSFLDYYRCPAAFADFPVRGRLSSSKGYFKFGDAMCYGRRNGSNLGTNGKSHVSDVARDVTISDGRVWLPFDINEVATNLRAELYEKKAPGALNTLTGTAALRILYYFLRPILPISLRKHLQRIHLSEWKQIEFPQWPVDLSVDRLMQSAMALKLRSNGTRQIPFIWFWPDGASSAAIVTHDVEAQSGYDFCSELMDIDESYGIKSSFQFVPEERYETSAEMISEVRRRGFEVNVHDLNHDGQLFRDRKLFEQRALRINQYAQEFKCRGFRAGAMFREQNWFDMLNVSYDMSVPNVAHLEPQRGGCCTVMPYFVGNVVELPLTTLQDYSLFHILNDYSIKRWKQQIDTLLANNGLISVLTHPDYLLDQRAQVVYRELLAEIKRLREERNIWVALPGDVERWYRSRSEMTLTQVGDTWRIEGPNCERARVAYATLSSAGVTYTLQQTVAEPSFAK